jgi:hypothetical protein
MGRRSSRLRASSARLSRSEEWGKDCGVSRSELWVTEANQAAVHFYESLDYLPTDDTQMLREGSGLIVRKLQKTI